MKTVDEIIAAIQKLKPAQFVCLQQKLERLEKKIWKAELARATERMNQDVEIISPRQFDDRLRDRE
jgi:hypothetical protein